MKTVAVIGGGITGLTAAFRLQQQGIPVTLFEAGDRVGGVIRSVRKNGFLAECGPNTILETSPKISSLVNDLGLAKRRMYSEPSAGNRYLVRGGSLVKLPGTVPGFLGTRLFSPGAKLGLLAEPFISPAPADVEESVEQFVLRRLGREFLDYAINPMVGGVYAGDPAKLSVKHAFPKLHALEQKYHSLIAGQFLGARERKLRAEVSKQSAPKLSFDEGLQVLTDGLRDQINSAVRYKNPVRRIIQTPDGWQIPGEITGQPELKNFSAVLFTGTAGKLAQLRIVADAAPDLSSLAEVCYPPVASVVLGFRREDVWHPLDGFGVLIPAVEKFNILGTLFSSSLFANRAPAGHVLLTSYIGGARSPELALLDPANRVNLVLNDLRRLLGVTGPPTVEQQVTFPNAIPQYEVGYGRFKNLMGETEAKCPGLFIAGHYRDGISLADSIVAGHDAAARIQNHLRAQSSGMAKLETHTITA